MFLSLRWKAKVGGSTDEESVDLAFDAMHEYYQFVVNGVSSFHM
jgi:hypothetical protein